MQNINAESLCLDLRKTQDKTVLYFQDPNKAQKNFISQEIKKKMNHTQIDK